MLGQSPAKFSVGLNSPFEGDLKQLLHILPFNKSNFCYFLFASFTRITFCKEIYSKRNEFVSEGSRFFPFRIDTCLEGR